ncbi:hypothetical protein BDV25DRAFT_165570 [Aspergillus avenaceus]|uniref:Uncharacterized protein n=1 Tax=Aspergillus avenaceus TaxID=36643 RepID=A0A5N6TF56_ASPAV|nr:hypothetical protein BDV25DRAFT_165570 [Aspergillus avenaceus]
MGLTSIITLLYEASALQSPTFTGHLTFFGIPHPGKPHLETAVKVTDRLLPGVLQNMHMTNDDKAQILHRISSCYLILYKFEALKLEWMAYCAAGKLPMPRNFATSYLKAVMEHPNDWTLFVCAAVLTVPHYKLGRFLIDVHGCLHRWKYQRQVILFRLVMGVCILLYEHIYQTRTKPVGKIHMLATTGFTLWHGEFIT